jgi:hypothetical protein
MKIEILMSPGCEHGSETRALVAEVVRKNAPGAEVATILVGTLREAERLGFLGSPSVRVDGHDIDPPPPGNVGLG